MQLESRDLRLVRAIVDAGGVTGAGKLLHLSQSAVSHQLAELERRVGASLFARVGRRMVATAPGARLAGASRPLLDELARLEAELRRPAAARRTLRIATECYTCYHWLPPLLGRFAQLAPTVDVEIALEATRKPLPLVEEGLIDLGLVSQPVSGRALVAEPLFTDEMVVIAAAHHPLAARPFVRAEDLVDETLFTHELSEADRERLKRSLLGLGRAAVDWKPRRVQQVPLTEAILELVAAGLGVSVLTRWAAEPQLRAGTLVARPLGKKGVVRQWSAVYRRADGAGDATLATFIELLRRSRAAGRKAIGGGRSRARA
jgi:LysR family transcriptional regulator, regulator for metE and metH